MTAVRTTDITVTNTTNTALAGTNIEAAFEVACFAFFDRTVTTTCIRLRTPPP